MNLYATVISGLEDIAEDEIARSVPEATIVRRQRGRLYLDGGADLPRMLGLRSTMNIYAHVAERDHIPTDADGLDYIERWFAEIDLDEAIELHRAAHGWADAPTFRVTAERFGRHAYQSPQIAAAAGAGIIDRYGWKASMKQYDVDVQVQVRDEHAEVSVRLSPESMGRRGRVVHGPASLNATIGYAMCIMAQPQAGEVFVDPMCGAGTVLLERAAFGAPAVLVAGDRHAPALEWARANFTAAAVDASLVHWDAARLPLGDATVDKLVCNMPWGRRIGSHRVNTTLYRRFMDEVARVLKPSGRAVLLTLERRLMSGIVARHTELYIARTRAVAVGGLEPAIHIVRVRAR